MNRRQFSQAGVSMALAATEMGAAEPIRRSILELRWMKLKTSSDNQLQRTSDFLKSGAMPALKKAGITPVGFFGSVIAPESPFILAIAQFPSLGAMETMREKENADLDYIKARDAYTSAPTPGYERLESSLLRCFTSIPSIEVPPAAGKPGRVFEMRMYESRSTAALAAKLKMFNDAEIGIFRRLGMRPVFFGETIVGTKMPNLVYMLTFDSLAHRESCWNAFGADAEWKELRSKPGNSDAELVTNISNSILRALPFSDIK